MKRLTLAAALVLAANGSLAQVTTPSNPASTLTLTSATTAYSASQFVANSATAGSVVVPTFPVSQQFQSAAIVGGRVSINDPTSVGWIGATVNIDLWSSAPTFTNGDRAAWAVATGAAAHLGTLNCGAFNAAGDGVYAECSVAVANFRLPRLPSGSIVYWTVETTSATSTTAASKTLTFTPEQLQ